MRAEGDDFAVEGRRDEFDGQRVLDFDPGDGQPAGVFEDQLHGNRLVGEGAVDVAALQRELLPGLANPDAREQVDRRQQIDDAEVEVDPQEDGE